MKLALSTLGCPELSLSEAAFMARDQGYSGLELRSGPAGTVSPESESADRDRWRRHLDHAGVEAVSIASYVRLCDTSVDDDTLVAGALEEIRLAHDLAAPWVRVFPGGRRDAPPTTKVEMRAARRLARIAAAAAELDVTVAIETHDSHPTARDVLRILDADGCEDVRVIWDMLHTWLGGELADDTVSLLSDRLAYAQVKDVPAREDLSPIALGSGVLPLRNGLGLLRRLGRTDWVSWEYERAWHPQAPSLTQIGEQGRRWLGDALHDGVG